MANNFIALTLCSLLCLTGMAGYAFALGLDTPLADKAQEARAKALFHEIRCVVCEGETIADSPADVASDMRHLIRQKIAAADSDDAIKTYLVGQYGDSILMKPPLNKITALLWFGPLLLLALSCLLARRYFRHSTVKSTS